MINNADLFGTGKDDADNPNKNYVYSHIGFTSDTGAVASNVTVGSENQDDEEDEASIVHHNKAIAYFNSNEFQEGAQKQKSKRYIGNNNSDRKNVSRFNCTADNDSCDNGGESDLIDASGDSNANVTAQSDDDNTKQDGKTATAVNASLISDSSRATVNRGRGRPRGTGSSRRGRGRGYLPPAVAEGLARHEAVRQRIYKTKYKEMKCTARSLVLENAALCDQVAEVQQGIVLASLERRYLLHKLHDLLQTSDHGKDNLLSQLDMAAWQQLDGNNTNTSNNSDSGYVSNSGNSISGPGNYGSINNSNSRNSSNNKGSNLINGRSNGVDGTSTINNNKVFGGGGGGSNRLGQASLGRQRGTQNGRRSGSSGRSKRLCPPITLDSAGRPTYPICLGPLTVHSLGEIVCERPAYHRPHVIYPVGFCSSRTYASVSRPSQPATYTCKILDGGAAPRFEIVCEDPDSGEELVFSGNSPAQCHGMVVDTINAAPGMPPGVLVRSPETHSIGDRGLRFFGLSHPSVQNVLQACPGARKCHGYQWVKFEVCRSEDEVERVLETERDAGLCHDTLLRNVRFARQAAAV